MVRRQPSREERALWQAAMREVRPLAARHWVPEPPSPPEAPAVAMEPIAGPAAARTAPPGPASGLDRRSTQRLRRGQTPITARLDLHGMTQREAHDALRRFLVRVHDDGDRTVLIITGKGGSSGEGVLRRLVPLWLNEGDCRGRILAMAPALPRHGGAGALYVLLRRRRPI